mmetsp:Transcript_41602/g.97100  ORF Transcript_41602/g.97100 Transcript_41602/m.97100 type:complete len:311 (+) Transcript_41602:707-1639(+)
MLQQSLHLNLLRLGARARLRLRVPARLNSRRLGLKLQQILPRPLSSNLILEFLPLEQTLSLLGLALGVVPRRLLLALCRDLNRLLHREAQSLPRLLVYGLHALDVDVGDDELVVGEHKLLPHTPVLLTPKHGTPDDLSTVLVKVIKSRRGDRAAHPGCDCFARVTDKVWNLEDLGRVFGVAAVNVKVPVVRKLDLKASMVACLDNDHIRHEIGPQGERQRVDLVLLLWLAPREGEDGELFIWLEHDEAWPPYDARRLLAVVVDLDGRVVRSPVCDDLGAVTRLGHKVCVLREFYAFAVVLRKGEETFDVL